ncbi:hypothetical protein GLOIN_2v1723542 [Rhizophagus irregularis DAOM 181602=DAOM 197198]|nr:hypothetical protein GLOIN_2v1723542 [Rhizophagus irregularis DAOM 181602=DAOM 197198]
MALAEDEEFDDEEGIKSKRKRRILVPLKYSDNEDDENKTEERKKKINENILSEKLQPFTLDEESELFVKKEIMAYVNF